MHFFFIEHSFLHITGSLLLSFHSFVHGEVFTASILWSDVNLTFSFAPSITVISSSTSYFIKVSTKDLFPKAVITSSPCLTSLISLVLPLLINICVSPKKHPLPGPVGIPLSYANLIKSHTIRK